MSRKTIATCDLCGKEEEVSNEWHNATLSVGGSYIPKRFDICKECSDELLKKRPEEVKHVSLEEGLMEHLRDLISEEVSYQLNP